MASNSAPKPSTCKSAFGSTSARKSQSRAAHEDISRAPPTDAELISKYWSHPHGKDFPAIVMRMNHFVNDPINNIFIPCEIAMVDFTIKGGMTDGLCTIVDPVTIPLGCGVEATNNAEKYGLPQLPFSETFREYKNIVKGINRFIENFTPKNEDNETFIFCLAPGTKAAQGGMEWLYKQAGEEFPYKIRELEGLLLVLTLGGLENLVVENDWTFPEIVAAFQTTAKIGSEATTSSCSSARSDISAFSSVSKLSESSYSVIGRHNKSRVAFLKKDRYLAAALGGFVLKKQATIYLNQSDFLHVEWMACKFHRGECVFRGQDPSVPLAKLVNCALLNVRNQLYLALDALLPNYKIVAKTGNHYPADKKPADAKEAKGM